MNLHESGRQGGRCVDCGQFISRNAVHYHGPKRKFHGRPKPHLFNDGGGMVTRCDEPEKARVLLIRKYAQAILSRRFSELPEDIRAEVEAEFPDGRGEVQRGRVNVVAPGCDEARWWWVRLDDDAKGPGITTAVVWNP